MPIGVDTYAYRKHLPHLVRDNVTYSVAFSTIRRRILPPGARTLTLRSCVHDHGSFCWVDCVVVMPDHVHLIIVPAEEIALATVLGRLKGASAYWINRLLGRRGAVWQEESFDRIVRSGEDLDAKREYLFHNPVRAGLVETWEAYPWVWFGKEASG